MNVNRVAAAGFGADAERYERCRSGYPDEAVSLLVHALDLRPGRTVLDIGAGTGKLTRLLLPSGVRVLAVEPVAAMAERLREVAPGANLINGAAEAVDLPDASVDAITCGQSFHWFSTPEAVVEMARVLRPMGVLALVWNEWSYDASAWLRELGALFDRLAGPDTPRSRTGAWREALRDGPFTDLGRTSFTNDEVRTAEDLLERLLTTSYVAALHGQQLATAAAQLRALVEAGAVGGRVAIPQQTHIDRFALRPAHR